MTWEKVICPLNSRLDSPVKLSVTRHEGKSFVVFSLSAGAHTRLGMKAGDHVTLYADCSTKQLKLVVETSDSSRALKSPGSGSRLWVEFPHKPLGQLLLPKVLSMPAKLVSVAKGELVIEIPAAAAPVPAPKVKEGRV